MNELMSQALELMVVGMGFVFVFLAILVVATGAMSKLVTKYAPEAIPVPKTPANRAAAAPAAPQVDAQLRAVISAAVKEYRSRHKK